MIETIKETPSPLREEGWGGGETPLFIELVQKNRELRTDNRERLQKEKGDKRKK